MNTDEHRCSDSPFAMRSEESRLGALSFGNRRRQHRRKQRQLFPGVLTTDDVRGDPPSQRRYGGASVCDDGDDQAGSSDSQPERLHGPGVQPLVWVPKTWAAPCRGARDHCVVANPSKRLDDPRAHSGRNGGHMGPSSRGCTPGFRSTPSGAEFSASEPRMLCLTSPKEIRVILMRPV
jgi:hypothetical protein